MSLPSSVVVTASVLRGRDGMSLKLPRPPSAKKRAREFGATNLVVPGVRVSEEPLDRIHQRMKIDAWDEDDFPLLPSKEAARRLFQWVEQTDNMRHLYELTFSLLADAFLWDAVLAGVLSCEYDVCRHLFDAIDLSEYLPLPQDKIDAVEALDELIVNGEIRLYAHAGETLGALLSFAAPASSLQARAAAALRALQSSQRELVHDYAELSLAESTALTEHMLSRIFSQYLSFFAPIAPR